MREALLARFTRPCIEQSGSSIEKLSEGFQSELLRNTRAGRPPIIFLRAILLGIGLNLAWPLHFLSLSVRLLGPLVTALRRSGLPAFLPGISPSWHFRPGEQAFHCDRANRSLPVQSQSHLSCFHPIRTRIVCLVEYSLAARNACSSSRHHCGGCDSTRRTIPRTELQRRVFELQGSGPPLVVRASSPSSHTIDRKVQGANEHSGHGQHRCGNIGIDQLVHVVEQEASVVGPRLPPSVPANSRGALKGMARALAPLGFPRSGK